MARLVWAVLCQRVIIDQETNSVSYIDAVEGFGFPTLPAPLPPIMLGSLWHREKVGDSVEIRAIVLDAKGDEIHSHEPISVTFAQEHKRYRINLALFGARAIAAGEYSVVVQQRRARAWTEVARLPLDIRMVSMPANLQELAKRK